MPFWPTQFLLKDQLLSLLGFPCMLLVASSLLPFNILSLCLIFVSLISMCLGVFLFGFILYGTLHLLDLTDYFLFHVVGIFNYKLFENFLIPFLFLFFFWDPYSSNVGAFDIVSEISGTILSSFHSFCCSALQKLFPLFYLPAH